MKVKTFEIYRDHDDKHRWRVRSSNGNIIGASIRGYQNRADCMANVRALGWRLSKQ